MLKTYSTIFCSIIAGETGEVSYLAQRKRERGVDKIEPQALVNPEKSPPSRTYRETRPTQSQHAIGRIREAVAAAYPQLDHATVGAIARRIAKQARFVRVSVDSPNDNLSFSRPGIGATNHKRRTSVKFSRFVRRQCATLLANRLAISDAVVERMQSAFRETPVVDGLALSIVSGRAAYEVYRDNDISWSTGTSCMCGDDADKVAHYFCKNPETIRLVVGFKGDEQPAIKAKLFTNKDGSHFLDRTYFLYGDFEHNHEPTARAFVVAWLRTQGISVVTEYDFTIHHEEGELMPYCDRADQFDRKSWNTVRFHPRGEFSAGSTAGEDESCAGESCCCCDCRVDEDDAHNINGNAYCDSCYSDRFSYCDETGEDESSDDVCHDEVDDRYILSQSAVVLTDGRTTHGDNATELDDEFYPRNTYAISEDCEQASDCGWILSEDSHEWSDGTIHHSDDVEPEPEETEETTKVGGDNV